ncbi:MAG: bifunctional diaminohydroxyphosphoribosylaminopyrimidine deaminase/5-amino-6-(5-phosphoribosylamino)uracil reductase RibD [Alphaproteobacteria bacterium]
MHTDQDFMTIALRLARRGLGNVWPNPAVGCVIVSGEPGKRVLGRGWTQPGGRPHSETVALDQARARFGAAALVGATAYVTLEPCSHLGRTPPCADALIAARVARMVVACGDPDARVAGRGIARLRDAGIEVETDVCREEAEDINIGFLTRVGDGRPMVSLKTATTSDGRIATRTGASQWITGAAARRHAHLLRSQHDAIAVGIGTAETDDPSLTCRLPGMQGRSPLRVVFDSQLRISLESELVRTAADVQTWVLSAAKTDKERRKALEGAGVMVVPIEDVVDGQPEPGAALRALGAMGVTRLMVEGGARLSTGLLRAGLVDRLLWFRAPSLIGGDGLPPFGDLGVADMSEVPTFKPLSLTPVGDDTLEIFARVP